MSRGLDLIFTILIAFSCHSASAVNHNNLDGTNGDGGTALFKLRTALSTPWGEPCETLGTCERKHQCLADGGKLGGRCGLLGFCCLADGELVSSNLKRSVFTRPKDLASPLSYYIQARTNLVCQLRIDFERLVLAEPSLQDNHPQCQADFFQVDDFKICGTNNGQHIYVPFNATTGATRKELKVSLANRMINPSLLDPDWKIVVTQLECPNSPRRTAIPRGVLGRSAAEDSVAAEESLGTEREGRARVTNDIPSVDAFWVAPVGCLQYFPEPAGVVESFNFNNGNGLYMGNMKYSICFRRTDPNQQLVLTANKFALGYSGVNNNNEGYDELCYTSISSPGRSEDYLFIPEATRQTFPNVRATRFCGASIDGVTVISNAPGPLAIHFNSDTYYDTNRVESGFRLTYQIS